MTPVEIASDAIFAVADFEQAPTSRDCAEFAETALAALRDAGWRIVKTDPYARGEVAFAARDDEVVEITEEWSPS